MQQRWPAGVLDAIAVNAGVRTGWYLRRVSSKHRLHWRCRATGL
jgi:hypothetical protein